MGDTESGVAAVPAAGGHEGSGSGSEGTPQAAPTPEGGQPAPSAPETNVTVPLHVVERVRQDLSAEKAARQKLEDQVKQFTLTQQFGSQQVPSPQEQAPAAPAAPAPAEDPLAGMGDDDLVEAKHIRKVLQAFRDKPQAQPDQNLATTVAQLQLQVQDPQYEATITNHLPEMLSTNPMWRDMIKNSPNPLMAAHAVAKMAPSYIQAQQAAAAGGDSPKAEPKPDLLADLGRIIDNATKPGNPGSVGGGSGGLSGNDRFKSMSNEELDAEIVRVMSLAPS